MTLPTGETLPQYDGGPTDEPVDIDALWRWLIEHRPNGWDGSAIRDVLAALQAVGDATLVKNQTYRMMRQDGARIERLTAWLASNGYAEVIVQHDGDPVAAAVEALTGIDAQDWQS